jgi:hypothetical protein
LRVDLGVGVEDGDRETGGWRPDGRRPDGEGGGGEGGGGALILYAPVL